MSEPTQPIPKRAGTIGEAMALNLMISVVLCWLPVLGPLLAGFAGGRRVRRPLAAFAAALLPALIWGIGLGWVSRMPVKVGGTEITAGPLEYVAIVNAASILAGALFGSVGGVGKVLGIVLLAAGLVEFVPHATLLARLYGDIKDLTSATKYEPAKNVTCPDHLTKLYKALSIYADQWDSKLPPADHWMSAISDPSSNVVGDEEMLHCPEVRKTGAKYGYSMNPELGGKPLPKPPDAAKLPLLYDSSDLARDAHAGSDSLPKPGRHTGKNNILYADGHVEAR